MKDLSELIYTMKEKLSQDMAMARRDFTPSTQLLHKVSSTDWADMLKMHINQVNTFKPLLQFNKIDLRRMIEKISRHKKRKTVIETDKIRNNDVKYNITNFRDKGTEVDNDPVGKPIVAEIDLNLFPRAQESKLIKFNEFCNYSNHECDQHSIFKQPITHPKEYTTNCGHCTPRHPKKSLCYFFESILRSTSDFSDEESLELEMQILAAVKNVLSKRTENNFKKIYRNVSCITCNRGPINK